MHVTGPGWELCRADWEAAPSRECDAVITDPPYSDRTHAGHDEGGEQTKLVTGQRTRRALSYVAWAPGDMARFVGHVQARARGWVFIMTDHVLFRACESATASSRYSFAPVMVQQKRPRLMGDGPASWFVHCYASRPRSSEFLRWRCLPGGYESLPERGVPIVGAKPVPLMRQVVRDYSNPGDVVCDPCAGSGSTLIAAIREGRRAIGFEPDPDTFDYAVDRLRKISEEFEPGDPTRPAKPRQRGLF